MSQKYLPKSYIFKNRQNRELIQRDNYNGESQLGRLDCFSWRTNWGAPTNPPCQTAQTTKWGFTQTQL